MSDYFKVNSDKMRSEAENLSVLSDKLETGFADLSASMAALNESWEGDAKDALLYSFRSDLEAMKDLLHYIRSFTEALHTVAEQYEMGQVEVQEHLQELS